MAPGEALAVEPGLVAEARITPGELDLSRHLEAVSGSGFGAVVTFIGQIRDHDPEADGRVARVEYTAHPDAASILLRVAAEAALPGTRIAVSHRIGMVEVGQPALVACVASAHRALAYEVSRQLIEKVKTEVPIWKRQIEADGSQNWQGLE